MLGGDAEGAEAVEDGGGEAGHLGKVRVDVERVGVAAEAVEGRLLFGGGLVDDDVGGARGGRFVGGRGGGGARLRVVARRLGPAEAPAASEEEGHLVVEDVGAAAGVLGGDAVGDDGGGALVDDVEELGVVDDAGGGGDGELADFEVLFAVEEHDGVEVGDELREVRGEVGGEGGDHAVGREDLEVGGAFVHEGQVGALGAETEVWFASLVRRTQVERPGLNTYGRG